VHKWADNTAGCVPESARALRGGAKGGGKDPQVAAGVAPLLLSQLLALPLFGAVLRGRPFLAGWTEGLPPDFTKEVHCSSEWYGLLHWCTQRPASCAQGSKTTNACKKDFTFKHNIHRVHSHPLLPVCAGGWRDVHHRSISTMLNPIHPPSTRCACLRGRCLQLRLYNQAGPLHVVLPWGASKEVGHPFFQKPGGSSV